MAITSTQQTQIVNLYVGMFNKAPSAATLTSLTSSFEGYTGTDEAKLYSLAESISTSSDYTTMMASNTTAEAVALQLVSNAGLDTANIADTSDLAYHVYTWAVNTSNDGVSSHVIMAAYTQFINTQSHLATEAIWQDTYNKAANKAEVAEYYATNGGATNSSTIIASVTESDSTVATAKTQVDLDNGGQSFSLTTGSDELTGSLNNDTITGTLTTVGSADSIVDSSTTDNDTMTLELNGSLTSTFTSTNIENISITSYGANSVDMTKVTGVEALTLKDSTGTVSMTNINDADMKVIFEGTGTNAWTGTSYASGALSGSADTLAVELNTSTSVAVTTPAGFENATINVEGVSDINTWSVSGVTGVTIDGSGSLDIATGLMSGFSSINATALTGALTTGTANATTGYIDGTLTGASTGAVVTLGAADDNIGVIDASAATKSTTIKLGAGNDKLVLNAGGTAAYVFAEAGDDSISASAALSSADMIDGGEGTDTLDLSAALANNAMILRNVENINITDSVAASTATQTFTNNNAASTIVYNVDNTGVDLDNVSSGSTVTINTNTGAGTTTAGAVAVDYLDATEATATIAVNSGMTGALTIDDIINATVTLGADSNLTAADITTTSDTTDLTLTASGLLTTTGDVASTDNKLAKVTVTAAKNLSVNDFTSTGMTDISLTTSKDLVMGAADAGNKLDAVTLSATSGSITFADTEAIGKTTNTATLDVTMTAKDEITSATGSATPTTLIDIDSTKLGNISVTSTANKVEIGDIGASATEIGTISVSAKNDIVIGGETAASIGNTTAAATTIGTVTIASTAGGITLADEGIEVKDTAGLTVSLTAAQEISGDTSTTTATVVDNNAGNVNLTIAGATVGGAYVNASSGDGLVTLTATNTGGLTSTVTNAGSALAGETSTITLGNAVTTKTNVITLDGTVDTINVTGGTGNDTVAFAGTDAFLGGTFALGTGTNKVDFTAYTKQGDNAASHDGLIINLSSATVSITNADDTTTSVGIGKVAQYDDNAASGTDKVDTKGVDFTLTGVNSVVGSAKNDYIVASGTATTIDGGSGDDTIIGGAGDDTITMGAGADTLILGTTSSLNGADTITDFAEGTDSIDFSGLLNSALRGTGADLDTDAGTAGNALTADTGFITSSVGEADLEVSTAITYLANFEGGTAASDLVAGDALYFALDNGTDSAIFYFADADSDATVDTGEVVKLATLTGVANAADLVAAQMTDFA